MPVRYRCVLPSALLLATLLLVGPALAAQPFTPLVVDDRPTLAGNVAWLDIDGDGDQDLLVTGAAMPPENAESRLFFNNGDGFTREPGSLFEATLLQSTASAAGDYDNDGDLDVYLGNVNHVADTGNAFGSTLWQNDGGNLVLVDAGDVVAENDLGAYGASWGDYDNDGDLDLYVTVHSIQSRAPADPTGANRLFDNNGDGTFTENTTALPTALADASAQADWADYDADGDLDLTVSLAFFEGDEAFRPAAFYTNQLVETGTASFVQDTASGFATALQAASTIRWVDYDNDGDLDVYYANNHPGDRPYLQSPGTPNVLLRNDAGTFVEVTEGPHVEDADLTVAQVWEDFDNDGDLDLFVTNGTTFQNLGGNHLYRNDGPPAYTFTRASIGDLGATSRGATGAAAADYDADGDLDLYVTLSSLTGQPISDKLYRNDTEGANWVRFRLEGAKTDDPASTGSNRSALGAVVRVRATIGGQTVRQRRDISANDGYADQSDLAAHFGLGDATTAAEVTVTWPSGPVQTFTDVEAGAEYRLTEGGTLAVGNEDPDLGAVTGPTLEVYPNPAREAATFQYTLAEAGPVRLTVVDVLGRIVAIPVDGLRAAGEAQVRWNAADLPAGLYVVRLDADGATQTASFIRLAR